MKRGVYPCMKCGEMTAASPRHESGNVVCWSPKCRKHRRGMREVWRLVTNNIRGGTGLSIADTREFHLELRDRFNR